mmetsp:Transcript_9208/g.24523  ORF Transcript_9208/g.24523 Transcript_9208/m.24523 type:complete len:205 (+) Transcript_9208:187-801(+)
MPPRRWRRASCRSRVRCARRGARAGASRGSCAPSSTHERCGSHRSRGRSRRRSSRPSPCEAQSAAARRARRRSRCGCACSPGSGRSWAAPTASASRPARAASIGRCISSRCSVARGRAMSRCPPRRRWLRQLRSTRSRWSAAGGRTAARAWRWWASASTHCSSRCSTPRPSLSCWSATPSSFGSCSVRACTPTLPSARPSSPSS